MVATPRTLVGKIWDAHVVTHLGDGLDLLFVDRHLLHDLSGPASLAQLARRGLRARNPDLTFATPDHAVSTEPGRREGSSAAAAKLVPALRQRCREQGIRLFDLDDPAQGIVHVVGPELGLTLPGITLLCGDSHTCTHGGIGALAWGIGTSELTHVLATQTIVEARPLDMRVRFEGQLSTGVEPKDLMLHLIARLGADGGNGFAVEYAGSTVRALAPEGRMTLCNLSIELGAKIGIVAPDEAVFDYLAGRPYAPCGATWDRALAAWRSLVSDEEATFARDVEIDAASVAPQVSWGTSPAQTIPVDGRVPDPDTAPDQAARNAIRDALTYMGLSPGQPLEGLAIDRVFIGSCANARLSDLEIAAATVVGRRVAKGVTAWVVPGSQAVRREAERRGLDRVFREAGFAWREPGCSLCLGSNGELAAPGERCVSTTNRNFRGRQGPGARTHLVGAGMAAAAAVTGAIMDVRRLA
jgi:3-isopropylmalate/(R)-2-methylmalate dehydratase large subunit